MNHSGKKLLLAISVCGMLAGCSSGDINIAPATADNSTDNSVTNSNNTTTTPVVETNPCASYVNTGGQTIQGSFDGKDCVYTPSFVDAGNNLLVDMTIPALDNGGAHIFQGSLFVGKSYDSDASMAAAGITKGGDGPQLTIEAGATLAFNAKQHFMIINRGSQLFAVGTQTKPITITSTSDIDSMRAVAAGGAATLAFDAVQEWGGLVINGFGLTNKCSYTGVDNTNSTASTLATTNCHVLAEGAAGLDESRYGGANNNDSSGRMEYFVLKHTGAEVASGSELNGVSWGGVGRNTVVRNIEMYSVYDDGMEFFGGAVNIDNYVAVYARDDSIDIDEGYSGTITNALVIQSETDGNNCIEADGITDYSNKTDPDRDAIIAGKYNSRPTITNLTCIISPNSAATATHDPGAGWRLREGLWPNIKDSMVIAIGADSADSNYCVRIDDKVAVAFQATPPNASFSSVIFSCTDKTAGSATPTTAFLTANGAQFNDVPGAGLNPTATADTGLVVLEGTPPIYSVPFATMVVNGAAPTVTAPASGHMGALVTGGIDWTQGWTYGIHDGARAVPLWF
jgi:hypothetical protein